MDISIHTLAREVTWESQYSGYRYYISIHTLAREVTATYSILQKQPQQI